MSDSQIVVSTDGSALGNPNGPMGWGWANHKDGRSDAGGATNGTNQIGELCAVLQALRAHQGSEPLTIQTDSQYAINCSTKWVRGWKKKGWRNAAGKPVKNRELIEAIDQEIRDRKGPVKFFWVKGHAGDRFNEMVDDLARGYAEDVRAGGKRSYLPLEGWRSLINSPYAKGLKISEEVRLQLTGRASALDASADAGAGRDKTLPEGGTDRPEHRQAARTRPLPTTRTDLPDETEIIDDEVPQDSGSAEAPTEALHMDELWNDDQSRNHSEQEQLAGGVSDSGSNETDSNEDGTDTAENETETDENGADETTENDDTSDQNGRGLTASGDLTITPPPSRSPYFAGKELHISGSITFEADIDQKGRVHIADTPFRLHSIAERQDRDTDQQSNARD
ncbi:ribonuclease H family protein [Bifidobacterium xylocopae]|uniref:ribonuclease H n=1 Tax=Bifidobacterium xylocopae TaxID=2493119 RepID=A0A366KEY1_9BIFI|nr:ribonuclease H [Bifidobacterium xylocopae]RBP99758.1 ribonuclease HI [Bifidobacterium xylocopae]